MIIGKLEQDTKGFIRCNIHKKEELKSFLDKQGFGIFEDFYKDNLKVHSVDIYPNIESDNVFLNFGIPPKEFKKIYEENTLGKVKDFPGQPTVSLPILEKQQIIFECENASVSVASHSDKFLCKHNIKGIIIDTINKNFDVVLSGLIPSNDIVLHLNDDIHSIIFN